MALIGPLFSACVLYNTAHFFRIAADTTMSLVRLEQLIATYSIWLGRIAAALFLALLLNVFIDVIMRYLFNDVSIGMQELEWHLYATIFLLGVPFALTAGGHVRVDLFYERASVRRRAWINLIGTLVLLLPFALLVFWYGVGFAWDAYQLGEGSGDPGGLPYRWIIKSVIPFSFLSIAIAGIGLALRSINILRGVYDNTPDTEDQPLS